MSDFGEPWTSCPITVIDRSGHDILINQPHRDRASACVNSLSGIRDPAKFVERAKAMVVLVRGYGDCDEDAEYKLNQLLTSTLPAAEIAALAAEWTEEPRPRTVAEAIYGSENGR